MYRLNITVVCVANFCRSPVAHYLLSDYLNESFKVSSAGIIDFNKPYMDARSKEFLSENGIKNISHVTRRLTMKIVNESTIIFAMDNKIKKKIIEKFPQAVTKIKLLNETEFNDPISFKNNSDYLLTMNQIKHAAQEASKKLNYLVVWNIIYSVQECSEWEKLSNNSIPSSDICWTYKNNILLNKLKLCS